MKALSFIGGIFIYFTIISAVALDLGVTTSGSLPETIDVVIVEDPTFLDKLQNVWNVVTDNIGSFTQLLTFSADVPDLINAIFFVPPLFILAWMIISLIRGTNS